MKVHHMKDLEDLDPFSEDQIEITRLIDEEGKEAVQNLCQNAAKNMCLLAMFATRTMPLIVWQRAAHEFNAQAKRDGDVAKRHLADALWIVVKYIQDSREASDRAIRDVPQSVKDEAAALGFNVKEDEE